MYVSRTEKTKATRMKPACLALAILTLLPLTACSRAGSNEWENIDYSRIARENYRRENDAAYTPPTVSGCVDDDLYNCNRYR
jgi:hypothetical protein